jgi:predicted dehydrogenase
MNRPVRTAIIGCGGMARYHIQQMLLQTETTDIVALCEPSPEQYSLTAQVFLKSGHLIPPNQPDLGRLLREVPLDAAFIITPHAYHLEQTVACMEAGADVLLEKPMVMNTEEACRLIDARDSTGRLLVVAFPGSLSPRIRKAAQMLHSGEIGKLVSMDALAYQNWDRGQKIPGVRIQPFRGAASCLILVHICSIPWLTWRASHLSRWLPG